MCKQKMVTVTLPTAGVVRKRWPLNTNVYVQMAPKLSPAQNSHVNLFHAGLLTLTLYELGVCNDEVTNVSYFLFVLPLYPSVVGLSPPSRIFWRLSCVYMTSKCRLGSFWKSEMFSKQKHTVVACGCLPQNNRTLPINQDCRRYRPMWHFVALIPLSSCYFFLMKREMCIRRYNEIMCVVILMSLWHHYIVSLQ